MIITLYSHSYADFYVIPVAKKGYVDTSSGDAVAEDILSGKKVWVDGNEITGNIEVMDGDKASSVQFYIPDEPIKLLVPEGYYDGSGAVVTATESEITDLDADLSAGNIKTGVTIFNINGSYTGDANATQGDILDSKTAYVNGVKVTGSMPNQADTDISPDFSGGNHTIPAGYYNGSGEVVKDANLTSDKIRCGTTIYGIKGRCAVGDTGPAGGIIYYISVDGLSGKEYAEQCTIYNIRWGCIGTVIGAASLDDGRMNTELMTLNGCDLAVRVNACVGNAAEAWYIPASNELVPLLQLLLDGDRVGSDSSYPLEYLSSTEYDANKALSVRVQPGLDYIYSVPYDKTATENNREIVPIRIFDIN